MNYCLSQRRKELIVTAFHDVMIVMVPHVFIGATLAIALALGVGKPRPYIIPSQRQTIFRAFMNRSSYMYPSPYSKDIV